MEKAKQLLFIGILMMLINAKSLAGFLEMPNITEVPDLKRESLLKDLSVPSVRYRDPDPESGPRLNVTKFKLQGIVEYPDLGITKRAIEKLIERHRLQLMQEYLLLPSGYTETEIDEVIDMLVAIEKETLDRHVSDLELQKLVWLIREQRLKRGITLGTIETVADKITQFYRDRGFILATAYIPEQEIRDGVVTLTLLLGTLGEVAVQNNEMYDTDHITSVFDDALTLPITSAMVEENIYLINDFPGLNVLGLFEPGSQVGDTRLNLEVKQERRYFANIRYDNHGSNDTGEQRLYADVLLNNLIGLADTLHIGVLNSFSPENTTYYQVRYAFNLFSPRWQLAFGATQNQFVLAQNSADFLATLKLSGETQQTNVSISYKLKRSRVENYTFEFIRENVTSDLQLGSVPDPSGLLDDEINNNKLLFSYDVLQESRQILHQGFVTVTSGEFVEGADLGQDDKFSILQSNYTLLSFFQMPFFDARTRVIVRTSLQLTESALSSISQFSLGGPTRARGYPVDQFSADSAVFLGADWVLNFPSWLNFRISESRTVKDIMQPFLFFDAAYGIKKALQTGDEDSKAALYDIGMGLRIFYLNTFQGNLQFAFPISHDFTDKELKDPDDGVRLVFDLQYSFR